MNNLTIIQPPQCSTGGPPADADGTFLTTDIDSLPHRQQAAGRALPASMVAAVPVLASLFLAACTVGPNFHTPDAAVPGTWSTVPKSSPADLTQWWKKFRDPELSALVDEALAGNLGVQQAAARVRQARASRSAASARHWPWLSANASTSSSDTGGDGDGDTSFQGGFDASWEIDLFGGTRRNVEAAKADLTASEQDEQAARLSLAAEVALTYADLRGTQQQLAIARENLATQEKTTGITRQRADAGFASRLDLANAEAQVAGTRAVIPSLEASASQAIHALSVLLGREPGALVARLSSTSPTQLFPQRVAAGLPADLLRRRPDILAAEARAHSATARIGVAISEWFPKLTLGASLDQRALALDDWLTSSARTTSLGPALNWSPLQGGKINADIRAQEALRDQAVLTYRQTVLDALKEAEDAMTAIAREDERQGLLKVALAANRNAADLAMRLYTQGQVDFLNVLQTQRAVFQSEEQLAASARNAAANRIALCKALGGGW